MCRGNIREDVLGVVRLPKNLIIGVRSACAPAAEARRTFVASILGVDIGWLEDYVKLVVRAEGLLGCVMRLCVGGGELWWWLKLRWRREKVVGFVMIVVVG